MSQYAFCSESRYINIHSGFVSGNEFIEYTENQKLGYIMGVFDGLMISPVFCKLKDENYKQLYKCTKNMTNTQIKAIVKKYMEENPSRWDNPMNSLIVEALFEACELYSDKDDN